MLPLFPRSEPTGFIWNKNTDLFLGVALIKNSSLQDVWTRRFRFTPVALGPSIVPQCYLYSHLLFLTFFLGLILKCTSQMGSYNFRHLELALHSDALAALSQALTWRPWLQVDTAHLPWRHQSGAACMSTNSTWLGLKTLHELWALLGCFVLSLVSALPPVPSHSILNSQFSYHFPFLHPSSPIISALHSSRFSLIPDWQLG